MHYSGPMQRGRNKLIPQFFSVPASTQEAKGWPQVRKGTGPKGGKTLNIVNLTPHALNFMPESPDGPTVTIPPSGQVARCAVDRVQVDTVAVDGITVPVNQTQFGAVTGLPDPQPDTIYIVSAVVAQAVPDRPDVFIVDDAVRDDQGRIIGARALAHV